MDEETQEIVRLWNTNMSASQIAKRLGVTKNSVIGKISRLRAKGVYLRVREESSKPTKKPNPLLPDRAIKLSSVSVGGHVHHTPVLAIGTQFVGILDLKPSSCRYVVSDDAADGVYCGATRTHKAYCAAHAALCYVKEKSCNSRTRSRL